MSDSVFKAGRVWVLYALLVIALVYSAFAGVGSVYADDACTAGECNDVAVIAHGVCTTQQHSQVDFVDCTAGVSGWDFGCTNGYFQSGMCP